MAEFKCPVCAQSCARGSHPKDAPWAALGTMEPLELHTRLFVESVYDQDVSDLLCLCWLPALHSSGMSLHGSKCCISQVCRVEVSPHSPHHIVWLCATVQGRGCLCLDIFTFSSSFLSLKIESWGLHPSRGRWIFYCYHPLAEQC